jgi:hypothetical protein
MSFQAWVGLIFRGRSGTVLKAGYNEGAQSYKPSVGLGGGTKKPAIEAGFFNKMSVSR